MKCRSNNKTSSKICQEGNNLESIYKEDKKSQEQIMKLNPAIHTQSSKPSTDYKTNKYSEKKNLN